MIDTAGKAAVACIFLLIFLSTASANPAWSESPLQGNDGLSNLLMLYDEMDNDSGLNNNQISTFLTLYNCREDGVKSIGSCMSQANSEVNHPQEYISITSLPHNNVDLGEDGEEDSENSDEPLVSNYLYLEEAEVTTDKIGKKNDLTLNIDITKNDVQDIGSQPTIALLKNGVQVAEKQIYWSQDSVSFSWSDVWTGSEQEDVNFAVIMERKNTGDYQWNRQTSEAGKADIARCGPDYVYSNFHDSYSDTEYDGCIEHNEEVRSGIDEVEKNTGWTLKNTNSVVDTLKSVSGEESGTGETLSINTGENSYCGRVYFQNEYIGGEDKFTVDVKMHTMGDPDRIGWHQGSKTFFAEVNGETVVEKSIEHGNSESFQPEVSTGDIVRLGIVDEPSPPLFGCNSYDSRAHVEMTVEGSFYKNQEEESTRENVFRER